MVESLLWLEILFDHPLSNSLDDFCFPLTSSRQIPLEGFLKLLIGDFSLAFSYVVEDDFDVWVINLTIWVLLNDVFETVSIDRLTNMGIWINLI